VKILFNKKDTALIQMAEPQQAIHAINHLDKVKLWGKAIRVMHSKHTNVQVHTVFYNAFFVFCMGENPLMLRIGISDPYFFGPSGSV
jgi:hypothetical protein